jgi:uncharacterized protein YhaN
MRIEKLRLIAYGPFTDTVLDLSGGKEGFHLIYGRNEAGKSSALRAVRYLLYGIPERSADGFVHSYAKMRIGALIRSRGGDVLEFVRRKGRVNTLRAADDTTLVEETDLQRFLHGVDGNLFATMFGIGYEDLVRGGREILQGGGDVGRLVFAAGSGIANLREIQNELQAAADALFRPSGQKPKINETLSRLSRSRKDLQEAQLPGQEWVTHDAALQNALKNKKRVEEELADKQRNLHRLERIQEALPMIPRRRELLQDLKTVASAPLLPEDFAEKRRDLTMRLRIAQNDRDQALTNIETVKKTMAELDVSETVLGNAPLIEEVYRDLGSQYKATKDRVKLHRDRNVSRAEAEEILRSLRDDLTLENAEKLRIKKADAVRIQELGTLYEGIVTRMKGARKDVSRLLEHLADLEKQLHDLPALRNVSALEEALEQAERYGALENHCHSEGTEIRDALERLDAALKRQVLWTGSLEALEGLPVPSQESISLFEDRMNEAELEAGRLKSDTQGLEDARADLEKELEALRLTGKVPTEDDLQEARDRRDQGWEIVRLTLEGRAPTEEAVRDFVQDFPPASTLSEAYTASVRHTDEVADRLRREADRVAVLARLLAQQAGHAKRTEQLRGALADAEKKRTNLSEEWAALWQPAGIAPRSPREMRVWAQEHKALAARAAEIRGRKGKQAELEARIEAHRRALDRCLQSLSEPASPDGEALEALIKRARKLIEQEKARMNRIAQLMGDKAGREKDLSEARLRVQDSERELSEWQAQWEQAVRPLGLNAGAAPSQANTVMEDLKRLFDKLKDAKGYQKRIYGIDCDAKDFSDKVARLTENLASDLQGRPAEQAVMELNNRLKSARADQSKQQALAEQLRREETKAEKAAGDITEIQTQLGAMCEEAGCRSHDELPAAEQQSTTRRHIEAELTNLDNRLRQLSAGVAVDDFITQALEVDPDGISGDIGRLKEAIERLNREKSEIDQTIGGERTELGKMDGSARAAELAENIQTLLAGLENDVEQYARYRIAARVLSQAVDRYREKGQGPILKRASGLFSQITGGSFEGIRAEFDQNGQPVLVGVRPGGRDIVAVDGMSDGTADQLYLALRLAGLEEYLDKNEPMPFIVDDILIKFDDNRAVAALQALAGLSASTQVIFFTHHRHLAELAENNIAPSILVEHRLNA